MVGKRVYTFVICSMFVKNLKKNKMFSDISKFVHEWKKTS